LFTATRSSSDVGGGIAAVRLQIRGYADDRRHPIRFVLDGLQGDRCAPRDAEHQDALLCVGVQPSQDSPQIADLLSKGHASCVVL
jgi:hypothetical protein